MEGGVPYNYVATAVSLVVWVARYVTLTDVVGGAGFVLERRQKEAEFFAIFADIPTTLILSWEK